MAQKWGLDSNPVGTENWNVAAGFTALKLLKVFYEYDILITIAQYGIENIEESHLMSPAIKTEKRVEAIERLINNLYTQINNSKFACKVTDRKTLEGLKAEIKKVEDVLPGIKSFKSDAQQPNQGGIAINEKHFMVCFNRLRGIGEKILYPINQNGLIFRTSEEIDLEKIKEEMIDGG